MLSLSREMVTAVCQVLGSEARDGKGGGKLDHLRYPARPASSAYRPETADIARVVLGDLQQKQNRALDIATLANRPEVDVMVDGHAIVRRHLAVLAMTGAGKSTAARRIIEELAKKQYPIVIFDPRGDYTGLSKVPFLKGKVRRFYAQFPVFEEDADRVAEVVSALGYELTAKMQTLFGDLYRTGKGFLDQGEHEWHDGVERLLRLTGRDRIRQFGVHRDMYLLAYLAEAAETAVRQEDQEIKTYLRDLGWDGLNNTKKDAETLAGIKTRTYKAAAALQRMEQTNRTIAESDAEPLPTDRQELIGYGQISVISLAGYTGDFQATIYSIVADDLFQARMRDEAPLPALLLLEEAHNFAPGNASSAAEKRAISITRQIAQEGRKFGIGLLMISQRPSRLDETALSMCNSHIVMRMVNPNDQSYIRKVIESLGQEEARMLPDLDTGEAILSGQMINFPVLAKIKEPASKGEREEGDAFVELDNGRARWEKERDRRRQDASRVGTRPGTLRRAGAANGRRG
ncbi:MAG: ATP-binding protein [Verrucomicrobia bacterium]|nr:ATP-binding protein [Verrucomicrobiota bacterium]